MTLCFVESYTIQNEFKVIIDETQEQLVPFLLCFIYSNIEDSLRTYLQFKRISPVVVDGIRIMKKGGYIRRVNCVRFLEVINH